jgi:hypothetical protein
MSARDDAIKAATSGLITLVQPDIEPTEIDEAEARAVAELVVDAVIPHLLAPSRQFADSLKDADDGSLVTSDYAWIGRRLNALLDQIEGGESR